VDSRFQLQGRAGVLAGETPARFKKLKLIAPVGSDSLPWIPQKTRDIAKDIDSPIVITEGPIKAMASLQAGATNQFAGSLGIGREEEGRTRTTI
jgi:hypothetical protein